jgi:hypothetical protein
MCGICLACGEKYANSCVAHFSVRPTSILRCDMGSVVVSIRGFQWRHFANASVTCGSSTAVAPVAAK